MAKYLVEGFIKVKVTVEADSEDEALEVAEESFDFETHVDTESIPNWEVSSLVESDEDDEDSPVVVIYQFSDDEDDD